MSYQKCVRVVLLMLHVAVSVNAIPSHQSNDHRSAIVSSEIGERSTLSEYMSQRDSFLQQEFNCSFESDETLNENEKLANVIIMRAKNKEVNDGISNPYTFNPSRHIFEVVQDMQNSDLFKLLARMPKGALLHSHLSAICSADYLVSLTYWPNLWQCTENATIAKLWFSRSQPARETAIDCRWTLVSEERQKIGAAKYDEYVRKTFTLYDKDVHPKIQYRDINDVWTKMMRMFDYSNQMFQYAPAWKDNFKQAMKQIYDDNVQYFEFRTSLKLTYDLDGRQYTEEEMVAIVIEALEEFKKENPGFIGSKIIYAPGKSAPEDKVRNYFKIVSRLHARFPNFLAGYDMPGQEDISPLIINFIEQLLHVPKEINFYLHAGETNWFGKTDENLIDAVLLGSKRIGHGIGLIKHPKLMEIVKQNGIAIEINPISNQVLKLVDDQRNHPASAFMSQNLPLVVSSDDPSFWEVSPLTHDFYMAFLGIASTKSDIRTLKKLAKNSIKYSAMNEAEKAEAFVKWQQKWDAYIIELIENDINTNRISTL